MDIYGTTGLTYRIEQLIKEDTSLLILVSPYLKLNNRLKAKMNQYFSEIDRILFLYRKNEASKSEYQWLDKHSNLTLIPIENLHAKIYLNEHRCIVTSMNLYEYSQINNHEIGIEIDAEEYREEFLRILEEIKIMVTSQHVKFDFEPIEDVFFIHTVGYFYYQVMEKFGLYEDRYNSEYYIKFCNWARKTVQFEWDELYRDKTAILKATNLGRERFEILKSCIGKDKIFNA